MKRLLAWMFTLIVIGGVVIFSAAHGGFLGDRTPSARTTFAVIDTETNTDTVAITVHNLELYTARAQVGYTLLDPVSGEILFTSAPTDAGVVRARDVASVSVPLAADNPDVIVQGWAREVIAYTDANTQPALNIELAPDVVQTTAIRAVTLQNGELTVAFDISIETDASTHFRCFVTVNAAQSTDGIVILGERAYLSPYQFIEARTGDTIALTLSDALTLPPGEYAVTLWVQLEIDGLYEHYVQVTYGDLLRVMS